VSILVIMEKSSRDDRLGSSGGKWHPDIERGACAASSINIANGQSVSIVWTDPFLPSCDPLGCEPVNFWAALIPLKGYEKAEPDSAMQKRSLLVVAIAAVDLLILG
jgi:hypothetical protein